MAAINDSDLNYYDQDDTELETPERNYNRAEMVTVAVVLASIMVVTITMNFLIIIAFCTTKNVRKYTNYFYVSLAGTDIAVGLMVMPFMAMETLQGDFTLGKGVCLFWLSMDYFTSSTSVFNMTVICIDRYLAILQPMRYRPVRTQRVIISMIAAAWVCGFMAEVPATLLWEAVTGYSIIDYNDTCDVEWVDNVPYTLTSTFMTIIFPFIIMLVLYAQIYYIIRKRAKELGNFRHRVRTSPVNDFDSQTESTDLQTTVFLSRRGGHHTTTLIANSTPSQRAVRYNRVTRDKKAATTLGILLGFSFLSWIPWQIVSIVNASCGSYCTPVIIYDIALWMQYSNSMVNPFLYILRDKSFLFAVKRILHKSFCRCRTS
ncbi:5-hydroxytryptamine receptor 1D-like [Ptychodera flava]|uniref:5-hydroxytryptamine receptor 1D-like n=1 Tax=Ptychodera flava TaxID=63121 RepID=UPI003969F37D